LNSLGIRKNHPFIDGNKRTSLVVAELFLALNGQALDASDVECVMVWQKLAAGEMEEQSLSRWFEQHIAECCNVRLTARRQGPDCAYGLASRRDKR
jgi:death-on-curing protein